MRLEINHRVFFALVRAGLWEQGIRLSGYEQIDYLAIQELAEEQSVVGLVAAGMEHVEDIKIPKQNLLQLIGQTLQIEEQNKAMNYFIGVIVDKMREVGVYTLLVKGQGIAQCYCKPLWRSSGDVDLFLNDSNYNKALAFLSPMAQSIDEENPSNMHLGMTINPWVVELHGTLRSGLGRRIDKQIDIIQENTFKEGLVRVWRNGETDVFLPAPDNDVIFVFTHILQHLFKGGIGLRQICDWCRLLWTYRDTFAKDLLESRLSTMGLMSEWKSFAALAVDWLGMPKEAMPLYSTSARWRKKARKIITIIIKSGNFGHNRDKSYYEKYPYMIYKFISLVNYTKDSIRLAMIFPKDAMRVWFLRLTVSMNAITKGQ